MYSTGTFDNYNKDLPGMYTKMIRPDPGQSGYGAFGGVSIPVSIVNDHDMKYDTPIPVTGANRERVLDGMLFYRGSVVNKMISETLRESDLVYLVPVTRYNPAQAFTGNPADIPANRSFGYHRYGRVKWAPSGTEKVKSAVFHLFKSNGLRVNVTGKSDTECLVMIYAWNNMPITKGHGLSFGYPAAVSKKGITRKLDAADLVDDQAGSGAVYKFNTLYKDEEFNLKLFRKLAVKESIDIILGGGTANSEPLAKFIQSCIAVGDDVRGCYFSANVTVDDFKVPDTGEGGVAYITGGSSAFNDTNYYLLELSPSSGTLEYVDCSGESPEKTTIETASYAANGKVSVAMERFHSIKVKQATTTTGTVWDMPVSNPTRIVFSAVSQTRNTKDVFEDYLNATSQTSASIAYYPYWKYDDTDVSTAEKCKKLYRGVQQWFLDLRAKKDFTFQLLMDEDLASTGHGSDAYTLHNPHLVSIRSNDSENSELIGAYTAGLLSARGPTRTATASAYHGSNDKSYQMYTQDRIEDYYKSGVITYHRQGPAKLLYVDVSAYLGGDAEGGDKTQYAHAYTRNQIVRLVNYVKYTLRTLFFTRYLGQAAVNETTESLLLSDIRAILHDLKSQGALSEVGDGDVSVLALGETSLAAELMLRPTTAAEILYVTIGV